MTDAETDGRELYVIEWFDEQRGAWTPTGPGGVSTVREYVAASAEPDERIVRYIPESALIAAKLEVLDQLEELAIDWASRREHGSVAGADWFAAVAELRTTLTARSEQSEKGGR